MKRRHPSWEHSTTIIWMPAMDNTHSKDDIRVEWQWWWEHVTAWSKEVRNAMIRGGAEHHRQKALDRAGTNWNKNFLISTDVGLRSIRQASGAWGDWIETKRNPERIRAWAAKGTGHGPVFIFCTKSGYEKRRLRSKEQGGRNLPRTGELLMRTGEKQWEGTWTGGLCVESASEQVDVRRLNKCRGY